jgi:polyhydroxyalkanoate synthesis regulator phasin
MNNSLVDDLITTTIAASCRSYGKRSQYGNMLAIEWSFRVNEIDMLKEEIKELKKRLNELNKESK